MPNPFRSELNSIIGKVTSINVIVPTSIFEQSLIIESGLMWATMAHDVLVPDLDYNWHGHLVGTHKTLCVISDSQATFMENPHLTNHPRSRPFQCYSCDIHSYKRRHSFVFSAKMRVGIPAPVSAVLTIRHPCAERPA